MEEKNNLTNNDFLTSGNAKKNILANKNNKKQDIKKYNSKSNTISNKKLEQNNLTPFNDSKRKQKQIKQCFLDITNTKEKKEKKMQKEEIRPFTEKEKDNLKKEKENICKETNKSELKMNKFDNKTKNIKVNKIKIEKINLENCIKTNSNTNRDFYKRSADNNKNMNINLEQPNIINKYISDFYNSKKSKILLSVKDFNKTNFEKDLLVNNEFHNSEYNLNLINQFSNNNLIYENSQRYSNFSSNTYNNNHNNVKKINQVPYNSLKISFKNIKIFYAHLEIFTSLYLKRIFKFFIEKIRKYETPKINIQNINQIQRDGTDMNNYRPIVNVNNAHCSLYCSINLNQDKLFNSLFDNRNIYNIENNTFTPLSKGNEIKNIKQFNKDGINNINKRNRLLFISPEYDTTLNNNKNMDEVYYKSVYIPKKKISKSNTNLITGVKANNNNKNKNLNNKNIKSSPIKEMNINLKQINVCRLNDLNQLYLSKNQNIYKNNSSNFNFSEINPVININNNNMTNHVKYNNNNIFSKINNTNNSNNSNNNDNNEKPKLKKIQSTKNGIYMKPKDENKKRKIKEIKIQNKLTPLKKDIDNSKRENKIKSGNILNTYNSFNRNKNENNTSRIYEKLYTINDDNPIKKIYIKRGSKQKNPDINIKENLFDSYRNHFYSTFLNFKSNNNNIDDEILIKQIATQDKKVFINIKYINYMKNNYIKNNKNNILNYLNLKISNENSVSIINNNMNIDLYLDKEIYEKMLLSRFNNNIQLQDIYSFDNDKKLNSNNKIQSKNISFTFKDYSRFKEESQIIDENLYNFIFIIKNVIIKRIRKNFFSEYKKNKLFKKILKIKKNKIINFYFLKFKKNTNNSKQIKIDKNNCGVYHKINYNDDFNCSKKVKTNPLCKSKAYNLSSHNSINQFNSKNKISNKKNLKIFSTDKSYKKTNKFVNKEINIFVHNNKNNAKNDDINTNNIALNKLKNKFFLMRIKLIKNALKIIKNAL